MSNLAVLSLKNRALIALITIVAAVFGGLALTSLKQELIPSIEFPQLVVVSTYPGASPEVVSNDVSIPIETAIQGFPASNRRRPRARPTPRSSRRPSPTARTSPRPSRRSTQAINRIESQLPEGIEPNVISASIDDFPVIQLAVTGYDDEQTIQAELENTVVPELEDVAGVNAAQIVGGVGQRITITPDQEALAERGLLAAGDPRCPRPERRAVPGRRDHRGRSDPHGADRLEDHDRRRARRAPARPVRRGAVPRGRRHDRRRRRRSRRTRTRSPRSRASTASPR